MTGRAVEGLSCVWGMGRGPGMGTYGVRERDGGESRKCPIQQHGLSYISS